MKSSKYDTMTEVINVAERALYSSPPKPSSHCVSKSDHVSFQQDRSWWLLVTSRIYSKQKLQTSRASHGKYVKDNL